MRWSNLVGCAAGCATVLIGCGDGAIGPDAAPGEADDRGLVRLTFATDFEVANQRVYFQNADSSLVLSTRTDDAGTANAFMRPGGTVTLVTDRGNTRWIYSYGGVQPGDELVLDTRFGFPAPEVGFQLSIAPHPGASFYQLYAACERRTIVLDVTAAILAAVPVALDQCAPPIDLTVMAFSGAGGRAYLYRADAVHAVHGETVVLDGGYRPLERSTVTLTGVPPSIDEMFVSQQLVGLPLFDAFESVPVLGGAGQAAFDATLAPGGTLITRADPVNETGIGTQHATRWGPTTATTSLDLRGGLHPYRTRPTYLPTSNTLVWEEDDLGDTADTVLAGMAYYRAAVQRNHQWMILVPRSGEPIVRLPTLPDPELGPQPGEVPTPFTLVNIASEGGNDRVRPLLLGRWAAGEPWPIDAPTGSVRYQALR